MPVPEFAQLSPHKVYLAPDSGNVRFDHCTMIHAEIENEVMDFPRFWLVNSSVNKMAKLPNFEQQLTQVDVDQ